MNEIREQLPAAAAMLFLAQKKRKNILGLIYCLRTILRLTGPARDYFAADFLALDAFGAGAKHTGRFSLPD